MLYFTPLYPRPIADPGTTKPGASPRIFDWGGRNLTGGTNSGDSKPPTPTFRFLFGFHPLYFGNIGKSKKCKKIKSVL